MKFTVPTVGANVLVQNTDVQPGAGLLDIGSSRLSLVIVREITREAMDHGIQLTGSGVCAQCDRM